MSGWCWNTSHRVPPADVLHYRVVSSLFLPFCTIGAVAIASPVRDHDQLLDLSINLLTFTTLSNTEWLRFVERIYARIWKFHFARVPTKRKKLINPINGSNNRREIILIFLCGHWQYYYYHHRTGWFSLIFPLYHSPIDNKWGHPPERV